MYCRDVKQLMDMAGNPRKPKQSNKEHYALADAQYTKELYEWITSILPFNAVTTIMMLQDVLWSLDSTEKHKLTPSQHDLVTRALKLSNFGFPETVKSITEILDEHKERI